MSIRLQLILFGVVGNLLVALIFIFSFNYRENVQEDSSSESLLTLYEAAWFQTYNGSFNSMFKWQPLIGSNASFWDPNGEVFQDEVVSNGNYVNPFLDTVSAGRIGDAQYILDLFFEEDFDFGDLSYAMAYYPSGQRIYCGSSLDLLGIDACSPNARPDFFLNIDSYIQEIAKRPKQSVVEIKDITGENAGTLNQALAFPVKASGETLVVILLGIDIRKSLEIFEDEFEVRTAVKTQDDLISLNEYYAQLDNDEDNLFDQENFKLLSEKALSFREQNGSRFSSKDTELGSSITLLPLSAFLSADDAQLFIFKDERENILIAQSILNFTYAIAIISVLILISLVAFVTTRTFGGISRAIEVLDGLTKGDHTQELSLIHI